MDEATMQRVWNIARMEDGATVFPGAVAALIDLYNHYGINDIAKIEDLRLTYQQVWDLYNSTGKNTLLMHTQLYLE